MIRDRVKELRRVPAGELFADERNWREHPEAQQAALRGVLAEIGYADALLARETAEGDLVLIDGHLRKETTPDQEVPVLIVDLDEDEAAKLLTVLDPLAGMAEANPDALSRLIHDFQTDDDPLQAMVDDLAADHGIGGESNDPAAEWRGMPEFEHEDQTAYQSIHVHFENEQAVQEFAKLVEQVIGEKTRAIWYPEAEIGRTANKQYAKQS